MNGAVELYKACQQARGQADHGLRDLPRRRPRRPQPRRPARARAQPPHAAGRERRRLPQPRQALLGRLPRGPAPRQADARHGPAGRARRGRHRAHGLPGVAASASASSTAATPRRARTPTTCSRRFGRENVYFEVQKNGLADQEKANEGIVRIASEVGRPLVGTGDVHYLRREDYHHHTALLCVQTKSTLAAPKMTFDTNEFYLRSSEEMAQAFAEWPEALAVDARDRRALRRRDRARAPAHPALPPRGRGRARLPARVRGGGAAGALRRPGAGRRDRARRDGARRHRPHGLQRLLPDRLGLRQVGEGQRHRRRPGPRQRRRLDRRLLPADHRRRPAALRPAVRALPQPRARVDAGHRHRLLGPRPRARDALRDREVRPRVGRADHHLRQDVPARGHARRRARARPRLRRRRPPGQAHPRPAAGPPAVVRRLPASRASRCAAPTTRTARPSRSSTSRAASRGSSATRRSTPRRSSSPASR